MNPYELLPASAFWKTAIANRSMFDISDLWKPRFSIDPSDKIITFGSCFAQHFSKALVKNRFNWHCAENGPYGFSEEGRKKYGYGVFSCRTGNIYTASLLRQWCEWAVGQSVPPDEYWVNNGRYFDPFRPAIEPDGFASPEEMKRSRDHTIQCFLRALIEADVFVFTIGLTESWFNREGYEYPMCPGTAAGKFDPEQHIFINQKHAFVRENLVKAIRIVRSVNPGIKFLLTVSPVPLTATKSGQHVLVATKASKSTLRSAIDEIVSDQQDWIEKTEEITKNGDFRFGLTAWIPSGSISSTGNASIRIIHDWQNSFSGIKQRMSRAPGAKRFRFRVTLKQSASSISEVCLSPKFGSSTQGVSLFKTSDEHKENKTFSGTVEVPWEGEIVIWAGSRKRGSEIEYQSISISGENSQAIDYFPSFEIIDSAPFKGAFFEPNQRSVNQAGVDFVMRSFFNCMDKDRSENATYPIQTKTEEEIICEEMLLAAFAEKK